MKLFANTDHEINIDEFLSTKFVNHGRFYTYEPYFIEICGCENPNLRLIYNFMGHMFEFELEPNGFWSSGKIICNNDQFSSKTTEMVLSYSSYQEGLLILKAHIAHVKNLNLYFAI